MERRKRKIRFTARAREDRIGIKQSSIENWGEDRARTYVEALGRACERLGEFPGIGRARDDIDVGLRSFPVGEHIIYYRVEHDAIRITRILHSRQDASAARNEGIR